jgi:outer membrane lipoprotein-sorting protein
VALAGLLWGAGACADDAGARVLALAERARNPDLDYAVDFRLDVADPGSAWKSRSAAYTMIAQGKDRSLVLMREPAAFHPGVLLIADGGFWLLLPRSSLPIQLSPRQVLGGDIASGDIARGNLERHYDVRLDGEEPCGTETCFRLELARRGTLGTYSRIRAWIAKEGYFPRRFAHYGETGALLNTATYGDWREGPLGLRPMRIEVRDAARPGETSTLTFSNLRPIDASGLPLSRHDLVIYRDAALAKLAEDGLQVEAEELLARVRGSGRPRPDGARAPVPLPRTEQRPSLPAR